MATIDELKAAIDAAGRALWALEYEERKLQLAQKNEREARDHFDARNRAIKEIYATLVRENADAVPIKELAVLVQYDPEADHVTGDYIVQQFTNAARHMVEDGVPE
jgi:ABC-type phosphate transport system auxiliary subunit